MHLYSKLAFIGALLVSANTLAQPQGDRIAQQLMNKVELENDVDLAKGITTNQAKALAVIVIANGYSCRSISSVQRFAMSRGYTVYCNGFNYSYDLKDVGGNLQVTAN